LTVSSERFRQALGHWASGVAIVTSRAGDRVHGMTVSAFSSVSLDPPLVLVCAEKTSETYAVIAEAGFFAVNILSSEQRDLSNRFASKKDEHRRFVGLETREAVTGAPLLHGCLAHLDCQVVATHDAGDHVIYVGSVEAAEQAEEDAAREPLLHFQSAYRALA
jgi:flavin reductase (DIM6/NTAB) family NADH-FMN oxidoreductase RutF